VSKHYKDPIKRIGLVQSGHHHHFSSNVKTFFRESRRDNHTLKYALPSRESARGGKRALMLTILKDLLYK
jgi:hypothetical protein